MGCCLSSNTPQSKPPKPHLTKPISYCSNTRAPPPPHPLPEEETVVKEVLSETQVSTFPQNDPTKQALKHEDLVLEEPKKVVVPLEEVAEEVSEICSTTLSESCVSTATTATAATAEMNNAAEDDDEVTQVKKRRVAKDRLVGRPQKGQQSRRPEVLPGRVRGDASPGRVRSGLRDGRGQNINGMRRGSVMGPERRSRSPVTRVDGPGLRAGLGRCPSGRRTGKSPGRVGPPELKVERVDPKVENGDREEKLDNANDESLENPHVSLECFIFL